MQGEDRGRQDRSTLLAHPMILLLCLLLPLSGGLPLLAQTLRGAFFIPSPLHLAEVLVASLYSAQCRGTSSGSASYARP